MLHTTLILSIVPSFCLLNRNFPPNNPSALSIFNYRLGLSYLSDCRHAAVSCNGSTHTGSKQSCVNCVKILYCINLGHNNLLGSRVNFDIPKINKLHTHYATEHALVLSMEKNVIEEILNDQLIDRRLIMPIPNPRTVVCNRQHTV